MPLFPDMAKFGKKSSLNFPILVVSGTWQNSRKKILAVVVEIFRGGVSLEKVVHFFCVGILGRGKLLDHREIT